MTGTHADSAPPDHRPARPGADGARSPAGHEEPGLRPGPAAADECGVTDGFSFCTERPGHGPTHWDRRTRHEWSDDE